MQDLKNRLTSRKLWIAVGAFVTFVAQDQFNEAMAVVLTYIGAEGAGDVAERLTK